MTEAVIIQKANQWTGFYMITASVMKGLSLFQSFCWFNSDLVPFNVLIFNLLFTFFQWLLVFRNSHRRYSVKKMFLNILKISQESTLLESLFNKATALLKTNSNTVVSCEICKILRATILKNISERLFLNFASIAFQILILRY